MYLLVCDRDRETERERERMKGGERRTSFDLLRGEIIDFGDEREKFAMSVEEKGALSVVLKERADDQ